MPLRRQSGDIGRKLSFPASSQSKAETLDATIADLNDLDADQLRLQWRNHLGGTAPAHLPHWLLMMELYFEARARRAPPSRAHGLYCRKRGHPFGSRDDLSERRACRMASERRLRPHRVQSDRLRLRQARRRRRRGIRDVRWLYARSRRRARFGRALPEAALRWAALESVGRSKRFITLLRRPVMSGCERRQKRATRAKA